MEGSFTYAFQWNRERKTSPVRFKECTRSSSKERLEIEVGAGMGVGVTTTALTAGSSPQQLNRNQRSRS